MTPPKVLTHRAAQPVRSPQSLEEIIRALAYELYLQRGGAAGSPEQDWKKAYASTQSEINQEINKRLALDQQTMKYAQVLAHAVEIFGSRIRANAWLNRPNRIFNNQSPIQVLTQDPEAVEEELVRIDEGIFF